MIEADEVEESEERVEAVVTDDAVLLFEWRLRCFNRGGGSIFGCPGLADDVVDDNKFCEPLTSLLSWEPEDPTSIPPFLHSSD